MALEANDYGNLHIGKFVLVFVCTIIAIIEDKINKTVHPSLGWQEEVDVFVSTVVSVGFVCYASSCKGMKLALPSQRSAMCGFSARLSRTVMGSLQCSSRIVAAPCLWLLRGLCRARSPRQVLMSRCCQHCLRRAKWFQREFGECLLRDPRCQ